MNDPALSIPKLNPAVAIKASAQRGSTALRTRVFLDAQALQRIDTIREFVENELGASLSTSMVIRLALRVMAASLPTDTAGKGQLKSRIKAAQVGH